MLWFIQHLLFLRRMFIAGDTPRQLAFGFAMGMVLGLVPKDNLLAVAISMAILSVRVNIGSAMIAALLFSLVGAIADPLTHRIGEALLTLEMLLPFWQGLYVLPLMPWTSFNNTVVLGSCFTGVVLFYPTYLVSFRMFDHLCKQREKKKQEAEPLVEDGEANQPLVAA
jgi:uncharacterized protein (TIGR03546 family)